MLLLRETADTYSPISRTHRSPLCCAQWMGCPSCPAFGLHFGLGRCDTSSMYRVVR
jgi:hypothetical protein